MRDKLGMRRRADAIAHRARRAISAAWSTWSTMQAVYFDGDNGETGPRPRRFPPSWPSRVRQARQHMLESLSMYSDELMEMLLSEDEVPDELVHRVVRDAVHSAELTPVFLGSAYRNKGVQPLLDAVVRYLPSPLDRQISASATTTPGQSRAPAARSGEADRRHGLQDRRRSLRQLTFMRIYQGRSKRARTYYNQRTGRKERFSRIVRMHADKREDIDEAAAGDIVAVMGVDCASGDTYAAETEILHAGEHVRAGAGDQDRGHSAAAIATRTGSARRWPGSASEDPTLHVTTDEETGETLIAGMGELHLEMYVERIRREYKVEVEVGPPKVNYREAPTRRPSSTSGTRSRPAVRASMPTSSAAWSRCPRMRAETSCSRRTWSAAACPRSTSRRWKRASADCLAKGPVAGFPVVGVHGISERRLVSRGR